MVAHDVTWLKTVEFVASDFLFYSDFCLLWNCARKSGSTVKGSLQKDLSEKNSSLSSWHLWACVVDSKKGQSNRTDLVADRNITFYCTRYSYWIISRRPFYHSTIPFVTSFLIFSRESKFKRIYQQKIAMTSSPTFSPCFALISSSTFLVNGLESSRFHYVIWLERDSVEKQLSLGNWFYWALRRCYFLVIIVLEN